jgi:putative transcriptional regulator
MPRGAIMRILGVLVCCALSLTLPATSTVRHAAAAEPLANGVFLVAARNMRDPRFKESVVLITHPQGSGPFGVIINRPLAYRVSALFPGNDTLQGRDDVVYFGGPVRRRVVIFLVRSNEAPPHAAHVLADVYITQDFDWIDAKLKDEHALPGLRVYAGYAGWALGQLQNEIARGGWHVVPADAKTIFEKDPATIWPELIKRASQRMTRSAEPLRAAALS